MFSLIFFSLSSVVVKIILSFKVSIFLKGFLTNKSPMFTGFLYFHVLSFKSKVILIIPNL